jgi:hypothetical protein
VFAALVKCIDHKTTQWEETEMNYTQVLDTLAQHHIIVDNADHLTSTDDDEEEWVYTDYTNARVVTVIDAKSDGIQVHILSYAEYMKRDNAAYSAGGAATVEAITDKFLFDSEFCPDCMQPLDECACPDV